MTMNTISLLYQRIALMALLVLGATGMAQAYDIVGKDSWGSVPVYYNIVDGNAVITNNGTSNCYSGSLDIPSSVTYNGKTYTVTAVGDSAFMNCRQLHQVGLPSTVTSIGHHAFMNCFSLNYQSVSKNVTSIGDYAFLNCKSMSAFYLNSGLESIGKAAFMNCTKMLGVGNNDLGNKLTTIGDSAFLNCSSLQRLILGYALQSIGTAAFAGCSAINSLTCKADNPPTVGDETCFADFQDQATLKVGFFAASRYQSAEHWKEFKTVETFNDGIDGIYYRIDGNQAIVTYRDQNYNSYSGDVVIPESFEHDGVTYQVTGIGDHAFEGSTGVSSIIIPNSVGQIGGYAFKGCTGLASVDLPTPLTALSEHAFDSCGITSIIIPEAITVIPPGCFANCHQLETVALPAKLTAIGKEAFYRCNSLKSIDLPETVTALEQGAFKSSGLTSFTLPPLVTAMSDELLRYTGNMQTVTLHDKLTTIGSYSFANCGVGSIDIPLSVKEIKANAFYGSYLTSIVIPDSVTTLGKSAFSNCIRLTSVHIGNGIKTIDESTFNWCPYSPREVTFGDSCQLTAIGASAFANNRLEQIALPKTVRTIGTRAFESCKTLKTIDLGDSLTAIAGHTFEHCDALEEVKMPNTVKSIGAEAFSNCYNLQEIALSDSLTSISNYAFWQCRNLRRMRIPDMVTTIDYCLFDQCVSLEEVVFGQSLKTMGSLLFRGCSAIKNVTMLNPTPPALNAENNWGSNVTVYVPEASRYREAPVWNNYNLKGIYRVEDIKVSMATIAGDCGLPITGATFYRCDGDTITFQPQDNVIALKGLVPTHNEVTIGFTSADDEQYEIKDVVVTDSVRISNCHVQHLNSQYISVVFTINSDEAFVPDSCGVYYAYKSRDYLGSVVLTCADSSIICCQGIPVRPGWYYDVIPWVAYHGAIYQAGTVRINPSNYSNSNFTSAEIYPTSVNMKASTIIGTDKDVKRSYMVMDGKRYDKFQITGLDPATTYHARCIAVYNDGSTDSIDFAFTTPPLLMEGIEVRTLKQNVVMFNGLCNVADNEDRCGMEWERVGVEGTTQQKPAYVFGGSLANIVNRIALNTAYRYRPCYTSAAGNTYYGEWKEFSITDAVGDYEPILYNYGVMKLTPKTVTLRALVLAGSSDIQTQGFTYKVSHWSADSYYVGGSGQIMECTITDLKPGTPYVAHVSVYAGHNYVSRDVYFTTPQLSYDVNGDGEINIADVNAAITGIIDSDAGYDGSIDVNGDGENNIADVNAIIGIIVSDQ